MGPGGLRGLQIPSSGAFTVRGGFDSHTFPPTLLDVFPGLRGTGLKSAALIANPVAGPKRQRIDPTVAARLLREVGYEVVVKITDGPGHASELARQAAAEFSVVAALGGDGTVHEVACGLVGTASALAVLPCGSGNDFAYGLGIPNIRTGVAVAGQCRRHRLEVCYLDEQPFFNTAGFFISGLVSGRAVNVWRQAGKWRYILAAVSALASYQAQPATWTLEDEATERTGNFLLVEACNGPRAGGGFRFIPQADPFDGQLDICLIRPISLWTGLRLLPSAASGGMIEHEAIERISTTSTQLEIPEAVPYHLDGEPDILPAGNHTLRLEAARLAVLAPTQSGAPTD